MNERLGRDRGLLIVAAATAVAGEPSEGAFDDPPTQPNCSLAQPGNPFRLSAESAKTAFSRWKGSFIRECTEHAPLWLLEAGRVDDDHQ